MSTSLRSWRRSYTRAARASVSRETGDQSTAGGTGAYDGTEATSTGYVAASMPETPPSCTLSLRRGLGALPTRFRLRLALISVTKNGESCSTISLLHTCLLAHHVLELPLPDDEPPLYPDEEPDQDESDEEEDQDDEELSE